MEWFISVSDKWIRNILWLLFKYTIFKQHCIKNFSISDVSSDNWYRWHNGARCFLGNISGESIFIKSDKYLWRLKNECDKGKLFEKACPLSSVKVMFVSTDFNYSYIVFEYINSVTLSEIFSSDSSFTNWDFLAHKIVEIIEKLYSINLIHRDFTPSNILVSLDGNGRFTEVKVIDFAYAVTLGDEYIDRYIGHTSLMNLGQGFKLEAFVWDDAYSALNILDTIESKSGKSIKDYKVKLNSFIGRLKWVYKE
ncbi:protein kinase domain-containing protein [Colwellia sp. C1TZA3]|uniref:protein kinase domain-containing protein n=1 Tax=Colwellia sp. C1TZA3 TaxID=2508879 RepID=UPI0011B9CC36|nr:protein kinase [Colwellia sp. C1TZA3]TWX72952.1 protein kinase [Colwellia sp. C1TZA3]